MINIYTNSIEVPIDISKTISWLNFCLNELQFTPKNIQIILVNDAEILRINNEFLNHNYYTDIITFEYTKNQTLNQLEGDLYISIDTVKSNSFEYNTTFSKELHRVMIHGILHLTGLDDSSDNEKLVMRETEDKLLSYLINY